MTGLEYIRERGLEYRELSGQIVLKGCPFCGDQGDHFYMDPGETGPFFCHKCQEKGNLITLRKHLGDFQKADPYRSENGNGTRKPQGAITQAFPDKVKGFHRPDLKSALQANERLLKDPEALKYVTETRGLTMEAVNQFKLGLEVDKEGTRWLAIPYFIKGELINIKYRSLPPAEKTFRRIPNCQSVLFNADTLEGAEEIYITEGELDTISLWDQGIKNMVGVTIGAGSFDPGWIDQLKPIKKIYLCYDQDEAGQKGAREAARRLGYGRCFNVAMPAGQDINDFFRSGKDIFDFQTIVNQADRFDVAGVMGFEVGLKRYLEELKRPEIQAGIMTPWPSVNQLIPTGFQPGELVVLSAPPKIGKSSWALQIAWDVALKGVPALFYCLEMRPMKLVQKIVQGFNRASTINDSLIMATRRAFHEKPLYLGYCYTKPELNGIISTLKEAVQRYGLKLLVFDHLHFLCRSISNQVQEIGLAVQAFKFLAEEMEIPIILIAQPRKIQADSIMTAMDLKDSSSIFSDCDHLIILHRQRIVGGKETMEGKHPSHSQAYEPITLVRVEASRYNPGGEALLYFHGEWSRFDGMEAKR
jgi:twinkle protein